MEYKAKLNYESDVQSAKKNVREHRAARFRDRSQQNPHNRRPNLESELDADGQDDEEPTKCVA